MEIPGKTIFSDIHSTRDVENGFVMVFHQPISYSEKLLEFINFERQCCPSTSFELYFEPNQGPINLKISGTIEMKEQVLLAMKNNGHF